MLSIDWRKKGSCGDRSETEKGKNEHYRSSQGSPKGAQNGVNSGRGSPFSPHLITYRIIEAYWIDSQTLPMCIWSQSLSGILGNRPFSPYSYTSANCFQINPLNVFPSRTIFSFNLSLSGNILLFGEILHIM